MGMSTHVVGVRDLDGRFADMIKVKLACEAAGVEYPHEVSTYFNGEECQSEEYLTREMVERDISEAVSECSRASSNVWEVDIESLPEGVKAVRFCNSY